MNKIILAAGLATALLLAVQSGSFGRDFGARSSDAVGGGIAVSSTTTDRIGGALR